MDHRKVCYFRRFYNRPPKMRVSFLRLGRRKGSAIGSRKFFLLSHPVGPFSPHYHSPRPQLPPTLAAAASPAWHRPPRPRAPPQLASPVRRLTTVHGPPPPTPPPAAPLRPPLMHGSGAPGGHRLPPLLGPPVIAPPSVGHRHSQLLQPGCRSTVHGPPPPAPPPATVQHPPVDSNARC
jgi:hypothetical protein